MPCPHNEITIVQRSQRQSAVAAAAYQSGEKLFCEYDQQVKHYPEKRGIVHNEILLPANAPQEYTDRNTLWNAAEAVEKQWNSQLARRWVLTIPREIPPDQYAVLVREFCEQQFVSKGMIADFAIHDPHPPGHNPHAHVMLTMRAMDEHGKWLPKSRKVYDLDENGERIKLPSGRWKSHKEDTVDWNDQKYCEIWRHEWEVIQNRYLETNDRPERVDLRSYARQGLDIVPTIHEGAAVRQMEKRGIQTNIGNLNREIRAANSLMKSIRQLMWDFSVIKDLLMNPVYTGAIASQKKDYRFKIGTIGEKKPEDWIVVEGQHEPLIDRMSFDIVQNKLKSRQRPGQTNEISLFAGLIKCGECGKSLTIRYTNAKHPQQIYSCKTYNAFGKNHCTQHRIDYDTLYSHVLRKIRECARAALMDGEAVADRLTNTCEAEQREQREAMERSLTRDEERIEVLDKMVMRLYEDMIAGRISEQNFNTMLEKTQTEQTELKTRVSEGRKRLSDEVQLANDAKQWVEAIQEYANITELDAATLNRLIKEIVVHERIDEDKTRHISIEIHFNLKPIPEVEQVTA